MFPEKPKNKRKNDHRSRLRLTILLLSFAVAFGFGIFVYLSSSCCVPAIKILNVQSLHIHDKWAGLSQYSPIIADYTLTMADGSLDGEAYFSIANDAVTQQTPITIPTETVDAFIKMLETAQLEQGPYEPRWEWTDDYPYISMVFQTEHGKIEIFTRSQGESHTPWGAEIDGVEYVIASDIPMQALILLESYLQRDILDTMVNDYRR